MKLCTRCKKKLVLSFFYKDKSQKDGFNSWCKACVKQYYLEGRPKRKPKNPHTMNNHIHADREDGLVYLIQGAGLVKIGWTPRPVELRFKELQEASPVPLLLVGVIPGGRKRELALHEMFSRQRRHGEWFHEAVLEVLRPYIQYYSR